VEGGNAFMMMLQIVSITIIHVPGKFRGIGLQDLWNGEFRMI